MLNQRNFSELLDEAYRIDPNVSIHVPINNYIIATCCRQVYIYKSMYFYEQLSFSYTKTDICFVGEGHFSIVSFIQQPRNNEDRFLCSSMVYSAITTIGSSNKSSKRVHLQLLF